MRARFVQFSRQGSYVFRFRRVWRLEVMLLGVAMSVLILAGGRGLAQIREATQADRDDRRIERRIDTLQKAHDDLRLEIERRLVRIETYVTAGTWLLGGIGLAVLGQLGKGLLDLVAGSRKGYLPVLPRSHPRAGEDETN